MGLRELARAVSKEIGGGGVTHAYLSTIESGRKPAPRVPILKGLASVLAVPPLEMEMAAQGWTIIRAADLLKQLPNHSALLTQVEHGTASSRDVLRAIVDSYDETPLALDMPRCLFLNELGDIFVAFRPLVKTHPAKVIRLPPRRRVVSA